MKTCFCFFVFLLFNGIAQMDSFSDFQSEVCWCDLLVWASTFFLVKTIPSTSSREGASYLQRKGLCGMHIKLWKKNITVKSLKDDADIKTIYSQTIFPVFYSMYFVSMIRPPECYGQYSSEQKVVLLYLLFEFHWRCL